MSVGAVAARLGDRVHGWARRLCVGVVAMLGAGLTALPSVAQAQASPSAGTTGYRYDLMGRQTGVISPDPDGAGPIGFGATRMSYNSQGLISRLEVGELSSWQSAAVAPVSWTAFNIFRYTDYLYDPFGRKLQETVVAGGITQFVTQFSYDSEGRLECTAVRMNPAVYASLPASACTPGTQGAAGPDRITKNVYDAHDFIIQIKRAVGTPIEQNYATYTRTSLGAPLTVTDANGNVAQYTYDAFGRLQRWTFPSTTTAGQVNAADYEEYGYDANGNRTSLRKRDGSTLSYSYDALNRMTVKSVPAKAGVPASATRSVYYSYDLRGLQTAARFDGVGGADGITTGYDGFGRVLSSTSSYGGVSRTLTYQYDLSGNRTRLTYPDGTFFTYAYDGLDRMTGIYENGAGQIAALSYDNQGRRATLGGGVTTSYGYDAASHLASLSHDLAGTAQDSALTFSYNPANQIVQQSRSNDAYAWTGAVNVSRSYGVNGLNQYTSAGPATFSYDANANLTGDGSNAYTYDVENRLVAASGASSATLVWDPNGRLLQTSGAAGANVTRFLYDGDALVAEYDAGGALLRRYVHGPQVDEPLVEYEGAGLAARRVLRADHQGSVIAVTDASGNAIAINVYDEWGIPGAANAAISSGGRFQYTGQAWIPELRMYHYKARIYSPTLGRFLQTDPIGYTDQINLYAYVGNDPVDGRDPTGLYSSDPCAFGATSYCVPINEFGIEQVSASDGRANNTPPRSKSSPGKGTSSSPQSDDILVLAQYRPGGNVVVPKQFDPLDPVRVNKPLTPAELAAIANTLNDISNRDHRAAMALNPHRYNNYPSPTGAILPPSPKGYTAFDLSPATSPRGAYRVVINNGNGMVYYTNNHYNSFYQIVQGP